MKTFEEEKSERVLSQAEDASLSGAASGFLKESIRVKYSYNFTWMGRPVIQYPQDIVAVQELIWAVKPDLVIETGIAHGGSLVLSASMLALLDMADAIESGELMDPRQPRRKVIGIDVDIRTHNREAIEAHPMASRITMIEGSSISPESVAEVCAAAEGYSRVLVLLDSNHTHDHVLRELELYSPMVGKGSYLVVYDTVIEDMPSDLVGERAWGHGNNPKTAVWEFLKSNQRFVIDHEIEAKLLITVAPDGYLQCVGDIDPTQKIANAPDVGLVG